MRSDRAIATWRETEAIRMRREGLDYAEIANVLNFSNRSGAWKATQRALLRTQVAEVESYRNSALLELDTLSDSILRAALTGNGRAVDRMLRIGRQRMRLLNLDHAGVRAAAIAAERRARREERFAKNQWRRRKPSLAEPAPQARADGDAGCSRHRADLNDINDMSERPQMVVRRVDDDRDFWN